MLLGFMLVFAMACQRPQTESIDPGAEKEAIKAMVKQFEACTSTDTLATFLTDDALVTGTAPAELWTKQQMIDMWHEYFEGMVPEHTYLRENTVKVAADGKSATVIEEYIMPVMSPKLQARHGLHLVKIGGNWMIDFINISFIPKNEDISKIDEVIEANVDNMSSSSI